MSDSSLIPGIPDDITSLCLALVPRKYHGCLQRVSKGWRAFTTSESFFAIRRSLGVEEHWLVVLAGGRHSTLRPFRLEAFDAQLDPLPSVPSLVSIHPDMNLFLWGARVVSVAGRYVYLLGGCHSTDQISTQSATWCFDGVRCTWSRCAPMLQPRSDFAAVSIGSRFILVAGGWSLTRVPLASAEVYDCRSDRWHPLVSLHRSRGGCLGVHFDGRVLVLSGIHRRQSGDTTTAMTLLCGETMEVTEGRLERLVGEREGEDREGEEREGEEREEESVGEEGAVTDRVCGSPGSQNAVADEGRVMAGNSSGDQLSHSQRAAAAGALAARLGRQAMEHKQQSAGGDAGAEAAGGAGGAASGADVGSSGASLPAAGPSQSATHPGGEEEQEEEEEGGGEGFAAGFGIWESPACESSEGSVGSAGAAGADELCGGSDREPQRKVLGGDGSLMWTLTEGMWRQVSLPGSLAHLNGHLFCMADIASSLREFDKDEKLWKEVCAMPYPQKGFQLVALNGGLLLLGVYGGHWLIPQRKVSTEQELFRAGRKRQMVHWAGLASLHCEAVGWTSMTL